MTRGGSRGPDGGRPRHATCATHHGVECAFLRSRPPAARDPGSTMVAGAEMFFASLEPSRYRQILRDRRAQATITRTIPTSQTSGTPKNATVRRTTAGSSPAGQATAG
jgi:hypothetical protein